MLPGVRRGRDSLQWPAAAGRARKMPREAEHEWRSWERIAMYCLPVSVTAIGDSQLPSGKVLSSSRWSPLVILFPSILTCHPNCVVRKGCKETAFSPTTSHFQAMRAALFFSSAQTTIRTFYTIVVP
ncbi:hypothetical protein BGY98DRAFT_940777 [Russula aff. rugulosa BPL654]|nr:hypothetical protein BGY98DRAFT_940777 [Russula aff. rugulosa BPL654]